MFRFHSNSRNKVLVDHTASDERGGQLTYWP